MPSFTTVQYLDKTMKLLQLGVGLTKLSLKPVQGLGALLGQPFHLLSGGLFQGSQSLLTGSHTSLKGFYLLLLRKKIAGRTGQLKANVYVFVYEKTTRKTTENLILKTTIDFKTLTENLIY